MGFYNFIKRLYHTHVDATGLAVFRIFYGIILLAEVLQIIYFRHLIFDPIPYIEQSEIDLSLFLWAWAIAAFLLIIGLFTRAAAIVNYVITLATFSAFHSWEYHLDYSMTGINFLLMFMPVANTLSADNYINKKFSIPGEGRFYAKKVSILNYYIPLILGIGFVYFDSIFYKFASHNWLTGLGFWLPASLPMATWLDLSFILNNEFISLTLGYITLVFELVFLFLIFFKKLRWPLIVIGFVLHIGILFSYPIPWFGLGVAALYILLIPEKFWMWLTRRLNFKESDFQSEQTALVAWDEKKISPKVKIADIKVFLIALFIMYAFAAQLLSINQSTLIKGIRNSSFQYVRKQIESKTYVVYDLGKKLFGFTRHPVFMDNHFKGYNHIVAITYFNNKSETWLPIIDKNGQAGVYNTGRQWVNWTFRVVGTMVTEDKLEKGIRAYTSFWAKKNNISLSDATFNIKVKKIEIPKEWEKNFLREQINNPWMDAGIAIWKGNKFDLQIKDIEGL